jgi:ArsR family transcriptional regulator
MAALAALHTTLKLLADPVRLRLVALLSREELAVHELMAITGLAQSRVSNLLSLLKRSAMVRDRKEGNWSFHSLAETSEAGPLTPSLFAAAVQPYLDSEPGRADLAALAALLEQRRERSRVAHERLAASWDVRAPEWALGTLRAEAFAALVPPGLVAADLGCGPGYLAQFLLERGARVIAVDHAPAMLAAARRRLRGDFEVRRGELDALPLADGEVDAAFANLVWHHLPSLDAAAREAARVVRPGGTVVITDLLPHDAEWLREELGDLRLGLRPQAVGAALARAGFERLATLAVQDRYLVESKDGRTADLPLFLVRGIRAAALPTSRSFSSKAANSGRHEDSTRP